MKIIRLLCLLTVSAILFCGCANHGITPDNGTEELQSSRTVQTSNAPFDAGFALNRLYRISDVRDEFDEYQIRLNEELNERLNEENLHFEEDLSKGEIPGTISIKSPVDQKELCFSLKQQRYERRGSALLLCVEYFDPDSTSSLTVDAETLGDRYFDLYLHGDFAPASGNSGKPGEDEMTAIANDIILPKLKKIGVNENDCYALFIPSQNAGGYDDVHYHSKDVYVKDQPLASVYFDDSGRVRHVFASDQYILSTDFKSRIPSADEIVRMAKELRDEGCDCELTFEFTAVCREFQGTEFIEISGYLRPSVEKPSTHEHTRTSGEDRIDVVGIICTSGV